MRLTRCYVADVLTIGLRTSLPLPVSHHLLRVLRLGVGDRCCLFNGDGCDYEARIVQARKHGQADVELIAAKQVDNESSLDLILVQGLTRGQKMDFIVQKAVELGIKAILPVMTHRSEMRLDDERSEKRMAHWRGVLISACEQSGRACLPTIAAVGALSQLGAHLPASPILVQLDPNATQPLRSIPQIAGATVVIAAGPEGGWAKHDCHQLSALGFVAYRLGPRVLRAETAGIAAIAALQAVIGDL